jgi:ferredoxin
VALMRVAIDATKCEGHGICALMFGERIELDRWGFGLVECGDLDDRRLVRRARRAAAACPKRAIVLVDDRRAR